MHLFKVLLDWIPIVVVSLNVSVFYARTIKVCSSGCPTKTIKNAIENAKEGDTILIYEGRYKEAGIIIKVPNITIKGTGKVIVDAGGQDNAITVFYAPGITIENIKIVKVPFSQTGELAGITIISSNRYYIKDVSIDSSYFGILVQQSDSGTIEGCVITSGTTNDEYEATIGNGIHLWKCKHALIRNNRVWKMRDGIYFEFVSNSVIVGNHSIGNKRYGLHFMFSNDNIYQGNKFEGNGAGVAVMFSKNIIMHNNIFMNNWGMSAYGLLLKEIYDCEVKHNTFMRNTTGIHIEGSARIKYEENDFMENGWAINFIGGSYDNYFYHNNFVGNTFDVAFFGRINNNKFEENYWSKYTGYDIDRDGYGDVPYRPVDLFSYMVNQIPEAIILLRSFFVQILNFAEQVVPVLTPADIYDSKPLMQKWKWFNL